jgi:glycosyltransferase involved in cell wall biosynthesis
VKLIIQIPCLNESLYLPGTLAVLPRALDGFDCVELMVIDDGSTDGTADVARAMGVNHVLRMHGNQGLARAFMTGMMAALDLGADVIVNVDGDNQYCAADIGALVRPILAGDADMTIGARPIRTSRHFSVAKRLLQALGSQVVRTLSGTTVVDATSGFRAMTRYAALQLNVFSSFTYTIETVIQAGVSNLRVISVPVRVNAPVRSSRLFGSNLGYIWRSLMTMLSVSVIYRPTRILGALALLLLVPGLILALRYAGLMLSGEGTGHVQSVVFSGTLLICSLLIALISIVAHLQAINRRLLEEIRYLLRAQRGKRDLMTTHGFMHASGPTPKSPSYVWTSGKAASAE